MEWIIVQYLRKNLSTTDHFRQTKTYCEVVGKKMHMFVVYVSEQQTCISFITAGPLGCVLTCSVYLETGTVTNFLFELAKAN